MSCVHSQATPCPACDEAVTKTLVDQVDRLELAVDHYRSQAEEFHLQVREHPKSLAEAEQRGERRGIARSAQVVRWMADAMRRDERDIPLAEQLEVVAASVERISA